MMTRPRMLQPRSVLVLLLATTTMLACSGVLESNKPAREIYLLQPPGGSPATPAIDAPTLALSLSTVPGLDTDNILALSPNSRLIPIANAHWPDNLPEVMSSLSRRSLIDSGLFSRVNLNDLARPGEWQLQLELQAFYGIQGTDGNITTVLMQLEGTMRCGDNNAVFRLDNRATVGSASLADVVAAHQQALGTTLQQLPARIQETCDP
jgi:ABC-type uncharacterized transport system auxiliary subunit